MRELRPDATRRAPARRGPAPAALLVLLSLLGACGAKATLRPFHSDGCSLFPDGRLGERGLWCECCFRHDIAYWRGGTEAERKSADEALRACVFERTRDPRLAAVMYEGVRLGGSPVFLNWYRWGYGWPYGRGYAPLTAAEAAQADERLAEYFRGRPGGYCAGR